jgi:CheY-like chemotaxis protein
VRSATPLLNYSARPPLLPRTHDVIFQKGHLAVQRPAHQFHHSEVASDQVISRNLVAFAIVDSDVRIIIGYKLCPAYSNAPSGEGISLIVIQRPPFRRPACTCFPHSSVTTAFLGRLPRHSQNEQGHLRRTRRHRPAGASNHLITLASPVNAAVTSAIFARLIAILQHENIVSHHKVASTLRDGAPPFIFKAGRIMPVRPHASPEEPFVQRRVGDQGADNYVDSQCFLHRRKILVVEDDPLIALDLKATLEHAGMVVKVAARLADAMLLVQTFLPDAAVLDARLEVGTSLPLAAWLAERGVPFLFQTSDPTIIDAPHSAAPVLRKPFRPEDLIAVLVDLLATRL